MLAGGTAPTDRGTRPLARWWRRRSRPLRRIAAAGLLAIAAGLALSSTTAPPPKTTSVLVASADLPAGRILTPSDLRPQPFLPASVPPGALSATSDGLEPGDPSGRRLALPVPAGLPVTEDVLVEGGMGAAYGPGLVAAPVRLADAETTRLVQPGDLVSVLAARADRRSGRVSIEEVAVEAPVLLVPRRPRAQGTVGALVVLAVPPSTAQTLLAAQLEGSLGLVLQ